MVPTMKLRRSVCSALTGLMVITPFSLIAAPLNLAQQPLFVKSAQKPNLLVTLDDSGSMAWGYAPDSMASDFATSGTAFSKKRAFSAHYNPLYFDPNVTYAPPLKPPASGGTYAASYTSAPINGFDTTKGSVDLSGGYRATTEYNPSGTAQTRANHPNDLTALGAGSVTANVGAYYYVHKSSCADTDTSDACYTLVKVNGLSAAEKQNFANWYSFYRTRNLMVASAATLAFADLDKGIRLGWQSLNKCAAFNDSCTGWSSTSYRNKIRRYETNKDDFYNWLSRLPANSGTPLRAALQRTGNYLRNGSGVDDPYAFDPQQTELPRYACRASYAVLMTDGRWNSNGGSEPTINACSGISGCSNNNVDGTGRTLPDGKVYVAAPPYSDTTTPSTLSDLAFAFWAYDLRTDIDDLVPRRHTNPALIGPENSVLASWSVADYKDPHYDPANWQHLTTYTIGLGLTKMLAASSPPLVWGGDTYSGSYSNLVSGATAWPAASDDSVNNVSDLWHAAINSRGKFFSADSATDVINAFKDIVGAINSTVGAAGAAAVNGASYSSGAATYISSFHPLSTMSLDDRSRAPWNALVSSDAQMWWGDLVKYNFVRGSSGLLEVSGTPTWSAASRLIHDASVVASPSKYVNTRTILSYNPDVAVASRPIPFRWANLSSGQQTAITGAASVRSGLDRLNWLRGDATYEGGAGTLRARPITKLGDIAHSSPVLVAAPNDGYADPSYAAFRSSMMGRTPVIYVGANDGMLHGFRESDGVEVMAYVPSAVYSNLRSLTEQSYPHRAFVDGHVQVSDAMFSDGWHSVLIGGLRAGGKGLFALDVTNPSFSESSPSNTVLWEFRSDDDPNLGYAYGHPVIAKLKNGKWAAIFGNGYNSSSGKAGLYVAYIEDGKGGWSSGSNFRFIDTGEAVGATPNGLSSPAVIDLDGDGVVDYAYAGDLYGNVWKFDLTSSSMSGWAVSKKLFVAKDSVGNAQPITTAPEATLHPKGGVFVLFGSGKMIEEADLADARVQSFYGVWDTTYPTVIDRSKLLGHVFSNNEDHVATSNVLRTVDTATPDWWDAATNVHGQLGWYVDLKENGASLGERVIEDPVLVDGKILFISTVPTDDPCKASGYSWLNEVDAVTGARLPVPPFDLNRDGAFDANDTMTGGTVPSSRRISPAGGFPVIVRDTDSGAGGGSGACVDNKVIKRSDGTVEMVADPCTPSSGRLNWRDLAR